jgi:alkylated DNA repair dioxygenase AlkB
MQLDIFGNNTDRMNSVLDWAHYNNQYGVPGLLYVRDFITRSEHDELLRIIDSQPWITDIKRRVQHYGWRYNYKSRNVDYSMYLGPIPQWSKNLALRLFEKGYLPTIPDQVIVNEYQPGQGIANHVDCEPCFGNSISSLSLGSPCVMVLTNLISKEIIELLLEPRSLIIIADEARYKWTHGIPARRRDKILSFAFERQLRISMTFRNVLLPNSSCFV